MENQTQTRIRKGKRRDDEGKNCEVEEREDESRKKGGGRERTQDTSSGRKKKRSRHVWRKEEDDNLMMIVAGQGPWQWPAVAKRMRSIRTGKQCRER